MDEKIYYLDVKRGFPADGIKKADEFASIGRPERRDFTTNHTASCVLLDIDENTIEKTAMELFHSCIKKGHHEGPFGDIIQIKVFNIENKNIMDINIFERGFWKAGITSDLLPIFRTKNNEGNIRFHMVTGIRLRNPGKGKNATFGGFLECDSELDSPMYTAIKEAEEEAGLKLEGPIEEIRTDYSDREIEVKVLNLHKKVQTKLIPMGPVKTSEQDRLWDGTKRVYITYFYLLPIDLSDDNKEYDENAIKGYFQHGDDMQDIVITDITDDVLNGQKDKREILYFNHHKDMYDRIIDEIRNLYLVNNKR